MHTGLELDSLGLHLLDASVDQMLLHFEVGDAVAQQSADAVGFFEDGDVVAGARELLRCGKTRGSGSDHGYALSGPLLRRLGFDPTFAERVIDDALFNLLDGDRRLVDPENAGRLTWRGADASGELGEIVGRVQDADCFLPAVVE